MAPSESPVTSRRTRSTRMTSISSGRSKHSSAYGANFDQLLADHNIFPTFYDFPDERPPPEPANLDEIRRAMMALRRSLSPSIVPESAFGEFQRNNKTRSEGTIMRNIIPAVAGTAKIPNEGHLPFTNLDSITGDTTAYQVPDFFDGALPGAVDRTGPGGSAGVLQSQAVHNGAHGAHAIYSLQNHLKEKPVYDGNAYTFGETYLDGQLKQHAHHFTAPTSAGERPSLHTTQLDAYASTGNTRGWAEGIGAFRGLRMLAKGYRDRLINEANARARKHQEEDEVRAEKEAAQNENTPREQQHDDGSPAAFFDCLPFPDSSDAD